jgi:signal transduction histidine kinase
MTTSGRTSVLLVDDNDTGRYSKRRILEHAGFAVIEAATGAEALRLVRECAPRLVLLDVHLPDVSGWDVCRRLKSDPDTASVLVLQMSATFVSEADTVHALEGGADACLTEPFEPPVLVATVRALLRARAAEDALRDALRGAHEAQRVAEAANRTKDEFLAMLSHELRTPLGTILASVGALRAGGLDPARSARALQAIERSTRLQVKLIEDLLDVSRIMSGKMRLDVGVVDLPAVVDAAIESVRLAAEAKHITLAPAIDRTVGPVSGDATRLQQVVWNLLSNAVKFTPKGGRVQIGLESVASRAELAVRDTGKGIEPAALARIFERFEQVDSSSTRSEGGLGLGLAIVRSLVELHGGTVDAESGGLGRGATFRVRLPLLAVRSGSGRDRDADPASAPSSLAGVRVLVVDDEPDGRSAIALVLEQSGARVREADSVATAMAALAAEPSDVLVSDIAMPHEDGYALIRRVRGSGETDVADVPALALTAYGGTIDHRRILASGFQACLTKPIEPSDLTRVVARLASRPR